MVYVSHTTLGSIKNATTQAARPSQYAEDGYVRGKPYTSTENSSGGP